MKTIVCSDCHGRPELVSNVIEHSGYRKGRDRLIFAGDFLDIGFYPIKCLEVLLDANAELLWGNHDLAAYLRHPISPQSEYDSDVYERLCQEASRFDVSTIIEPDILVTHAGMGKRFYNTYFNKNDSLEYINAYINSMLPGEQLNNYFWNDYSPIWYRPNYYDNPVKSFRQIFGHTPPIWFVKSGLVGHDIHSVDPWCQNGFECPDRFRYAVVEDGEITIKDSRSST